MAVLAAPAGGRLQRVGFLALGFLIALLSVWALVAALSRNDAGALGLSSTLEPVTNAVDVTKPVAPPITDTVDPIVEPITDTINPVVEPITDTVDPIVEPITDTINPVVEPITDTVDPILEPIIEPVTNTIDPIVEPIIEPVTNTIDPIVDPIVEPVTNTLDPIIEPVTDTIDPIVDPVVEPVINEDSPETPVAPRPGAPTSTPVTPTASELTPLAPGDTASVPMIVPTSNTATLVPAHPAPTAGYAATLPAGPATPLVVGLGLPERDTPIAPGSPASAPFGPTPATSFVSGGFDSQGLRNAGSSLLFAAFLVAAGLFLARSWRRIVTDRLLRLPVVFSTVARPG
jgi:hypothetical protein